MVKKPSFMASPRRGPGAVLARKLAALALTAELI